MRGPAPATRGRGGAVLDRHRMWVAANADGKLMNDTKWREVLAILLAAPCDFEVAWTWRPEVWIEVRSNHRDADLLLAGGMADPGFGGGPFSYREILAIRMAAVVPGPRSEGRRSTPNPPAPVREQLAALGKLPIQELDGFVVIEGYRVANGYPSRT